MDYLSRYMTFPKLLDMLNREADKSITLKIPFPSLESQTDPIEGVTNTNDFIEGLKATIEYTQNVEEDGGEIMDLHAVEQLYLHLHNISHETLEKMRNIRKTSYVSCWVNGKEENLPMWNLYAGIEGVLLTLDKNNLIKSLIDEGVDVHKDVEYEKYTVDEDEAPFRKNKYYTYENEYRFLIKGQSDRQGPIIKKIKLTPELNISIKTHPQIPEWTEKAYEKILDQYGIACYPSENALLFKKIKPYLS